MRPALARHAGTLVPGLFLLLAQAPLHAQAPVPEADDAPSPSEATAETEQRPASAAPGRSVTPSSAGSNANSVVLAGAVANPRVWSAGEAEGQRVSDLLEASGGLAPNAYALGAVLLRRTGDRTGGKGTDKGANQSADNTAHSSLELAADQLAATLQVRLSAAPSDSLREVVLRQVGSGARYARLPVAVDAGQRLAHPEHDQRLAAGDILYVPEQPAHVLVIGAVEAPGAQPYQAGYRAEEYLAAAGGVRGWFRKQHAAAVLPTGERRDLSLSYWRYEPQSVPPGSILIVPNKGNSLADELAAYAGRQ